MHSCTFHACISHPAVPPQITPGNWKTVLLKRAGVLPLKEPLLGQLEAAGILARNVTNGRLVPLELILQLYSVSLLPRTLKSLSATAPGLPALAGAADRHQPVLPAAAALRQLRAAAGCLSLRPPRSIGALPGAPSQPACFQKRRALPGPHKRATTPSLDALTPLRQPSALKTAPTSEPGLTRPPSQRAWPAWSMA